LVLEKLAVSVVAVLFEQIMLTHERDLLVLIRANFFCPNLAFCSMSKALWKGPDCEKVKSTCDNLGAVYSSDEVG